METLISLRMNETIETVPGKFKFTSSGSRAKVFDHPGSLDEIIRIARYDIRNAEDGDPDDARLRYFDWCRDKSSPFLPVVHTLTLFQNAYVMTMEKLLHRERDHPWPDAASVLLQSIFDRAWQIGVGNDVMGGPHWPNDTNIMRRADGTPVITDPWYGGDPVSADAGKLSFLP